MIIYVPQTNGVTLQKIWLADRCIRFWRHGERMETGLTDEDATVLKFALEALILVKDVIGADMAGFSWWLN